MSLKRHRPNSYAVPCLILTLVAVFASGSTSGVGLIDQALTDLQVLYLFDNPRTIDWPTLYYLNDTYACHVDLLTVTSGNGFYYQTRDVPDKGIAVHRFEIKTNDQSLLDSLIDVQFRSRRPDVVIVGSTEPGSLVQRLGERILRLAPQTGSIYAIRKVYRDVTNVADSTVTGPVVTIQRREMYDRFADRIRLEVSQLYDWFQSEPLAETRLMRYEMIREHGTSGNSGPDFLSGLEPLRLLPLLDTLLAGGAVKESFVNRARLFQTFFDAARRTVGAKRVDNAMAGHKALLALSDQIASEPTLSGLPELKPYLEDLAARAQKAVLGEIGMNWEGTILLRDSPHGPKLKFRASLSVYGPQPIELSYIRFRPYWDTTEIILDSISRKIAPHQSFVREYLVDIERTRLEATMPESLVFAAEVVYGSVPMTVFSSIPIWERPELQIEFQPDFFFVPPVAKIEVDRVVSAMNWKAVITKPRYYHGTVTLNLETPRGLFAGAYKQTWELDKDRISETVRIPFSVSNLFELGIQPQTITLAVDGRVVATDTAIIRIAACEIDDKVAVGLMPDTTGILEDILRMAGANYRPLTDRTYQTGDLDAYTVILVGSGALRQFPSFRTITGRLEEYLRHGGSLVVLGQPSDWPEGALPVSFVPSAEQVAALELLNRIPEARLLSAPYVISDNNLLAWLQMRRKVAAAVVSPAEAVYVTPTGATLLSVTRLDEGQIIFCGLPLVEMISQLNIEAIHLLANILNY
ncbi:MAG: hypothetical protein AB1772_03135 [Candidatus Zixiibacteriota bacterium]